MTRLYFFCILPMLLVCSPLLGQAAHAQSDDKEATETANPIRPSGPPEAQAIRVEIAPTLDGDVLDDPAWASAPVASSFWQTTPDEGHPATEATDVRIVYTGDTLYFGIVCYDSSPSSIIVSDSRRDSPLDETDSIQLILDTYHDRQNGFVFGTNPASIEYDAQVSNEGKGGSSGPGTQTSGAGGGFNINWDGAWEVRTKVGDFGWSVEFAIPFRTLRYPGHPTQQWGLNFQRNIRRRNETAFWAPLARQFDLYRLSSAGLLSGLEIPPQRNLQVIPYVLGQVRDSGQREAVWTGDQGVDAKYSISPSLTLDLTYNTDFAQVEVDEQQVNLNRFNLFFPEKRPFFLENAGLFAVGDPGEVELFFSRRIGISPNGTVIPILGGARLTGKVSGFNVGFLNMQTEEVGGLVSGNNFTVGRVSRELPNRSFLGAVFVNKQGSQETLGSSEYNRTFGFDGRWGWGRFGEVSGFMAGTSTAGLEDDQYAFKIGSQYDSEAWRLSANYTSVGRNFNPEVGFLAREDGYRKSEASIFHRYRPQDFIGIQELRPHMTYRGYWTPDGFQQSGFLHMDNHWEWKNGYEVHTGVNVTREGVQRPFEIFPGVIVPPGTYDHTEVQIVSFTNKGAPISFENRLTLGGFFGGDKVAVEPSMRFRVGETFNTELKWSRNDINLPGGDFVTNLVGLRVSYSFTPRLFVQTLVQYNDRADIWSTNFRIGWLQSANTGLFIVYNDTRGLDNFNRFDFPDRSLIIKYNRLFNLLN